MNTYPLHVTASSRRLLLVVGLCLFGVGLLFPTTPVEMRVRSAQPEEILVSGKMAFTITSNFIGGLHPTAIYTTNGDGSEGGMISPPGTYDYEPAWSPDGTKIAFSHAMGEGPPTEIYVMKSDGKNRTNLTNTPSFERNPSWSVTNKIAYERDGQIWTMNADGANQAPFTAITRPTPIAPAWSPDGTKLAFASDGGIWVINADGTNERRITINAPLNNGPAANPAWSPDGLKITFSRRGILPSPPYFPPGTFFTGINVINANGTNEVRLTMPAPTANDGSPAWSSDGTKITFARSGAISVQGIYIMNPDGTDQMRFFGVNDPAWQPVPHVPNTHSISGRIMYSDAVVSGVVVNVNGTTNAVTTTDRLGNYIFSDLPAGGQYTVSPSLPNHFFTPTQRSFDNLDSPKIVDFVAAETCATAKCVGNGKIAYADGRAASSLGISIRVMNWNGSGGGTITPAGNKRYIEPNWSRNGSKIAHASDLFGDYEIYLINAGGLPLIRLTNNPAADTSPYYSPDGSQIVFVSDRDGNKEIYKMNADGSNQVRLTTETANDFAPAFSPDGQRIIFVTERVAGGQRLFTMNADGSNQQVISDIAGVYNRPSYSPDGQKIIFSFGASLTTQHVWTMNADGLGRAQFPVGRENPAYSPNGRKVVFSCCVDFGGTQQEWGIHSANADGSGLLTLTTSDNHNSPAWQAIRAVRRASFDFDGDERADFAVFRPADGAWYLLGSQSGLNAVQWGNADDVLVPADYDGDLKTDVAVWHEVGPDGVFYILNSSDNTIRTETFGLAGDVPTPSDWDGDGKADLSVYRGGEQSTFYYRASMANPDQTLTSIPWGTSGDKPMVGDYDGDGKTDVAIFRPSTGTWYVLKSSDGQVLATVFGAASDKLVPADYDGDGKTDYAIYRDGVWYLLRSTLGVTAFQYGIASDTPAPADYDGDGLADAAVFRNGVWYVLKSQSGNTEVRQFGISGDKAVPSAYVR